MNLGFDIRDPDLRKLIEKTDAVTPEMFAKLILIVDNSLNIMKRNQYNDMAGNTAIALRRVSELESSVNGLRAELATERESRAKTDLERAEREAQYARQRLQLTTDAKLEVQKIFEQTLKAEMPEAYEELKEQEKETQRKIQGKKLEELRDKVITAIAIGFAMPVALGLGYAVIRFLAGVFKVSIP